MKKQDIVGYRTPLDAARRYKLEKVKVLKVAEDGSIAEVMLKGDATDGSKIILKADQIKLEGYTTINGNFHIDEQGNMSCNNALINGVLTTYVNNNLAFKIDGNTLGFYDYANGASLPYMRFINTHKTNDSSFKGTDIVIKGDAKRYFSASIQDVSDTTKYYPMIELHGDMYTNTETPYIRNTANGTLFDDQSSGGIIVENGLIKSWGMDGITANIPSSARNLSLTIKNGLIVSASYN